MRLNLNRIDDDESENLKAIFGATADGILLADIETKRLCLANASICQMLGYNREELLELSLSDIHPQDDLPRIVRGFDGQVKGDVVISADVPVKRKDGSVFFADINAARMTFGGRACLLGMFRDITARKRADTLLKASETQYRRLFEAAQDGILILDAETGTVVDVNPFLVKLLGLSHAAFLGKKVWELGFFKDLLANEANFAELRQKGYIRYDDMALQTSDGRRVEVEFVSNVYLVNDQKVIQCNIRDITTRNKAERELQLFRALIDRSIDGIYITDPETGRFLDVNDSACRELGYTRTELLALTVLDVAVGFSRAQFEASIAQCRAKGFTTVTNIVRRKDGSTYPAEVNVSRVVLGREYALAIVRNITERMRVEEAHARLATAVEQAAESIIITDTKSSILYANPAFEKLSGYSRAEAIGQNPRLLKSGKHDARFYRQIWDVLKRGEVWHGRIVNKRKDGALYEVAATVSPVRDAEGKITNYVSLQHDVTRESQLETQLRQTQKMEAIGQLASGVAHDFNNLLTVINGRSQLLMSRFKPGEKVYNDLELIFKTGERAAGLTRQLLAFSRKQVLQSVVIDLNVVAQDLDKMLRRLIQENIELSTVLDPALKRVYADPGQLEQVIMNLVINARDAMPNGGKLSIETANVELSEEYCRDHIDVKPGRYVMLAVSDTGHGMDAAVKAKIFEPFFTTKPQGKGTGLGLATVFGIVKQSNGHIAVYSEVGKGTTFKVYLPQTQQMARSTASDSGLASVTGHEVILIVEDEEGVRELVLELLTTYGYTVLCARNGIEALQVCQQHSGAINLLVTDVVMPEMGGPELADRMRTAYPTTKVLFTSGYTDHAIVQNGELQAGVDFIQKPFTPVSLARKIREVLDKV